MKKIDRSKYHWMEVKRLKDDFIGNETSDEYRETQPRKGLQMISECYEMLMADDDGYGIAMFTVAVEGWFRWPDLGDWYVGVDDFPFVLDDVFDIYWMHDMHPYDEDDDDLHEWMQDCWFSE